MAGFRNLSDDQGPVAEINITPLVDVMLVLLIIFMVTTPLLESGIAIQLPKASAKALPKEEKPVTLTLTKDSRIFLGKEEVDARSLGQRLLADYANRSTSEIFIRADQSLPYGFVAQTMAIVKGAGINKIGLVNIQPDKTSK